MLYKTSYRAPFGSLFLLATESALTAVSFTDSQPEAQEKELNLFRESKAWLDDYFQRKNPQWYPQLSLQGTAFQQKVWDILRTIPYAETISYSEIAKTIDPRMSAQAVGGAVARNPIAIIVPCHRVIGKNRSLTGYAGGLDTKKYLLELEGVML